MPERMMFVIVFTAALIVTHPKPWTEYAWLLWHLVLHWFNWHPTLIQTSPCCCVCFTNPSQCEGMLGGASGFKTWFPKAVTNYNRRKKKKKKKRAPVWDHTSRGKFQLGAAGWLLTSYSGVKYYMKCGWWLGRDQAAIVIGQYAASKYIPST